MYLAQYGSEAHPTYTLRHPDPSLPASRNRYAVALSDSYNPEVLYGEVLLIPEWTKPNPTAEELRLNDGIPPPPQPILPTDFTIQLYNPDQQVLVKHSAKSWSSSPYWEFEMPQRTFRLPSASAIDRTQSDPTASETTPKINFRWRRDGKLSKDLICSLSGKSTNPDGTKRKHKEPDIAISFFRHLRELTIYEPNLSRVEMEDPKGLEVVLLLSAAVLRDVYFAPINTAFNIADLPTPTRRRGSSNRTPDPNNPLASARPTGRLPPTDPRSQWELDAETARLKKAEEKERAERQWREAEETKRVQAMLAAEEKEARRKAAEVEKETERLRKQFVQEYQVQNARPVPAPPAPPRGQGQQQYNAPRIQIVPQAPRYSEPTAPPPPRRDGRAHSSTGYPGGGIPEHGIYLQPSAGGASSSTIFGGSALSQSTLSLAPQQQPKLKSKSSFFGLRSGRDRSLDGVDGVRGGSRLAKKQSSIF